MTTQKNAPSAVGAAAEGQITSKLSEENNVNDNQDTTTPEHAATDVAEALRLIDEAHAHVIDLEPSDALYQDIADAFTKPLDWIEEADESTWVHMAYPIDSTGRKVNLPGGDWWARHVAEQDPGAVRYWQRTANAAIRVNDLVVISLGEYRVVRVFEEDGKHLVEFATLDEIRRRTEETRLAWIDEHSEEMEAAKPSWANDWDVWEMCFDGSVSVAFEREIGSVTLVCTAHHENGKLTFDNGTDPEVQVAVGNVSDAVPIGQLRSLIVDLMIANRWVAPDSEPVCA